MKSKLSKETLIVLILALSVIVIALFASLFANDKGGNKGGGSTTPALTFPDVPDAPKREDIKVDHEDRIAEDTYEENGIEYIASTVLYPYFKGGDDTATTKINDFILAFVTERVTIKDFEKTNAKDAYQRAEQDAMDFIEFEFITRVESVYVKNGYLSVMLRRVRTVGISEPKEDLTTLCFDLLTGDEVDISAFLNVDEEIASNVVLDIFTQHIRINPNLYYNDALDTLPDIIDLKSFYLTESGLILYFNPDLITPSVMGICRFTVPYDKIGH